MAAGKDCEYETRELECLLFTDVEDRGSFLMVGMDSEADGVTGFYFKTKKWMILRFYCSFLKIVNLK